MRPRYKMLASNVRTRVSPSGMTVYSTPGLYSTPVRSLFVAGLALLALASVAAPAQAQRTPVYQSGTLGASSNIAKYFANGLIGDGSGLLGDTNGKGVNPFAVTDVIGLGVCSNSAVTNGPFQAFCLGHDATGALLTIDSYGGAAAGDFRVRKNGAYYVWPGSGAGTTLGPTTSTIGALAVWNNTGGTLLRDAYNAPVAHIMNFPASFAGVPVDAFSVHVGAVPTNAIPAGVMQGIVSKMTVPATYNNAPWPPTNFSAYMMNNNSVATSSAVGYFAAMGTTVDGSQNDGFNVIMSNSDPFTYGAGTGRDFSSHIGLELDFAYMKKGAAAPTGTLIGIFMAGASEVSPTTSYAINIGSLGGGTIAPWGVAYTTSDGAATVFASAGSVAGAPSAASQPIVFNSWDAASARKQVYLYSDALGDLIVKTPATRAFLVQNDAGQLTFAAYTVASAVNNAQTVGSATGDPVIFQAAGTDTNIPITVSPKGTGTTLVGNIRVTQATWPNNQACIAGQFTMDATYLYGCTADNTVKRIAWVAF